jgi:hypothetical protein
MELLSIIRKGKKKEKKKKKEKQYDTKSNKKKI